MTFNVREYGLWNTIKLTFILLTSREFWNEVKARAEEGHD